MFDGSDFPKQGRKSVGVARQYCGRLGKVANCQGGMFLAYVSPLGRALVDKRLYLPKSWTSDQDRCAAAVPENRRNYRSKTELALEMLERVLELGYLRAEWVAGDDAFGMSPTFREGLAALGMRYVLDVPGGTTVWPLDPAWTSPEYPGFGRPRKPKLRPGQRRTMEQRGDELPDEAWREITVAQGSQGPRTYRFSAQRVRATRRRKPGEELWAVWAGTWTAVEPRYYLSNAAEGTTLETPGLRGWVLPWRIETEFETEKGDVGLDEYETLLGRVASPHSHVPAGWSVPAEPAIGGKKMPRISRPQVYRVVRDAAPGTVRARSIAVVAGGYAATQRTGSPFPRETPLHLPRKQDGAATFKPVVVVLGLRNVLALYPSYCLVYFVD